MILRLRLLVLICVAIGSSAQAHVVEQMFIEFRVDERMGQWAAEVQLDAGYALPEMRADKLAPPPPRSWLVNLPESEHTRIREEGEAMLREYLSFEKDGVPIEWAASFIDYQSSPPDFPILRMDLAVTRVVLQGEIGTGSGSLDLSVSEAAPLSFVVSNTSAGKEAVFLTLAPGDTAACWEIADDGSAHPHGQHPLWLGYTHVLPAGLDHVLFMFGIFLFTRSWRSLLSQSLVFTLAHSVTLALVFFGIVAPPGVLVEVLVALSITAIAIENLWGKHVNRLRYATIFVFGLIHGLGFASALRVGLEGQPIRGLIFANLGIELAQITVIGAAWLLTLTISNHRVYPNFCRAISIIIGMIGLWWAADLVR